MKKVITRFAPSPTGYLHVGNLRTCLINWLYARKYSGEFILRMDDTDLERSKPEYEAAIIKDLTWLNLKWDKEFNQSSRLSKYEEAKNKLIADGRLYACYETPEELDFKRKMQLSRSLPPIYDRSSLKLTKEQKEEYEKQGRKPHYRFLIKDEEICWHDMIKGEIKYQGNKLSDPVIIRADGSMTYMLCSTVDDIDYDITHVIRGEDHVSNTAIQIQMFVALSKEKCPKFGHLSLVKAKDEKISKRDGGFEIQQLREEEHIEAMTINSFFTLIGSAQDVRAFKDINELLTIFDIHTYSKSPTIYVPEELSLLNHKLIIHYEYNDIKSYLQQEKMLQINEQFWLAVRPNLQKLSDLKEWWQICHNPEKIDGLDQEFLAVATKYLPKEITTETWSKWVKDISKHTGKKGKELFMPLRLALTGKTNGPELKNLLPLLSYEEIINRLK
ncbi:MAG: glutamate--tRNA ligase [Rickettsiaceae bacterium]|nr:glutamate--tRNA ligase [Rickettsiaceae bacterium]